MWWDRGRIWGDRSKHKRKGHRLGCEESGEKRWQLWGLKAGGEEITEKRGKHIRARAHSPGGECNHFNQSYLRNEDEDNERCQKLKQKLSQGSMRSLLWHSTGIKHTPVVVKFDWQPILCFWLFRLKFDLKQACHGFIPVWCSFKWLYSV